MKTVKKFKLILANNIEYEANWLTEMSEKGFHFFNYKLGFYYFEENHEKSYIYQTDFQAPEDEYFQLYKQAGWEHVHTTLSQFHYFRGDRNTIGTKRIYSDGASVKGMYQRMLWFYITLFIGLVVAQAGILLTWNGELFQKIILAFVWVVIVFYIYLFINLIRKTKKSEKQI